jgi:tartrate-resistant acid phosphatase type 5
MPILQCVSSSVSFLAIGDWGGEGYSPFTTAAQVATGRGMAKIAEEKESQFIVALGDNYYSDGVSSVESNRFTATWENVYMQSASLQQKW